MLAFWVSHGYRPVSSFLFWQLTLLACHSLGYNNLTNNGKDMSGILKLAEALPHSQLTSLRSAMTALDVCSLDCHYPLTLCVHRLASLAYNRLCGLSKVKRSTYGTYTTEGITALCEGLKGSAVTSLT